MMPTFSKGWFDMETMMTFKRLSSLTQDPSVVLMALAKSPNDLLQASETCRRFFISSTTFFSRRLRIGAVAWVELGETPVALFPG